VIYGTTKGMKEEKKSNPFTNIPPNISVIANISTHSTAN
jgi:hypothetical protein